MFSRVRARLEAWLFLAMVVVAPSACTLLVSTGDLSGPAHADGGQQGEGGQPDVLARDGGTAVDAASCRALRDLGVTSSAEYILARDGGPAPTYCEMESFDGGWTLVTSDMIASERSVQDVSPSTPARVSAARTTDAHGGVGFTVDVTHHNCGETPETPSPSHLFTIVDLEPWKEIMATYTFRGGADCWDLFGAPDAPDTNVRPFEILIDRFDRDENMARAADGTAIPFGGRLSRCDVSNENFWDAKYNASRRRIRVVQRRRTDTEPFGLSVRTDCGNAMGWDIADVFVR